MAKASTGRAIRDDVVQAALAEFREYGYERATVRSIAARAGMPLSTLYMHIGSKDELFLALVAPVLDRASARIEEIVAKDVPPREKLREAIISATSAFDEHYPELFIYLRDFYPVLEQADPVQRRRYEQLWADLINEGIASGDLRPDLDSKLTSYGMLGMVSWMHHWYRPDGRLSATEIGELFATMLIEGMARR